MNAICKAFSWSRINHDVVYILTCRIEDAYRINRIMSSLEKTLRKPNDGESPKNSEFEYSMSAVCEVPKPINLSEWFDQNTWNILFKPNFKQYNVKTVTLR